MNEKRFRFQVFLHAREMTKKWPFHHPDPYMNRPLKDIRDELHIRLA